MSIVLPEPAEVRELMNKASALTEKWSARLAALGQAYGVHGDPLDVGNLTLRVTRVGNVWGVYCFWTSDKEPSPINSCRLDEKLAFLQVAKALEEAYKCRIVGVYKTATSTIKTLTEE